MKRLIQVCAFRDKLLGLDEAGGLFEGTLVGSFDKTPTSITWEAMNSISPVEPVPVPSLNIQGPANPVRHPSLR